MTALLSRGRIPIHGERAHLSGVPVEVGDDDLLRGQGHDLVLAQLEGIARVLDERGDVRREKVLALADTDDERRVPPGSHDEIGLTRIDRKEGERTFEPPADTAHRLDKIEAHCWQGEREEMRHHLGIRL